MVFFTHERAQLKTKHTALPSCEHLSLGTEEVAGVLLSKRLEILLFFLDTPASKQEGKTGEACDQAQEKLQIEYNKTHDVKSSQLSNR